MANYYEAKDKPKSFRDLIDRHYPTWRSVTENERGLDGECEDSDTGEHNWFMYPDWSPVVREGGKQYLICLSCDERSHL